MRRFAPMPLPSWRKVLNALLAFLPAQHCAWCGRLFRFRLTDSYWCWIRYRIPEHCGSRCAVAEADYVVAHTGYITEEDLNADG